MSESATIAAPPLRVFAAFADTPAFPPLVARMLRVGDKPLQLRRRVRGIDLVDLPAADQCCGFGGTFAMTAKKRSYDRCAVASESTT